MVTAICRHRLQHSHNQRNSQGGSMRRRASSVTSRQGNTMLLLSLNVLQTGWKAENWHQWRKLQTEETDEVF